MRTRVILVMAGGLLTAGLISYAMSGRQAAMSQNDSTNSVSAAPAVRAQRSADASAAAGEQTPLVPTEVLVEAPIDASGEGPSEVLVSQTVVVPATAAPPFDAERFAADPDAYLTAVVPERIFQTAEPAIDVPQLAAEVATRQNVVLGDGIDLRVRTSALSPVTYCAADGGTFPNGRSTMSVRADAQGLASVRYAPSQGTFHRARVVAASPMTSGRVAFTLTVIRPETADLAGE